ncbi:MAG: hypothetical protein JSS55_06610 [Proteobacteria bacterium]|nr:hypothetical protein [Pseudomonadota bacterium]
MYRALLILLELLSAAPSFAQDRLGTQGRYGLENAQTGEEDAPLPSQTRTATEIQPGRTATSSAGQVGQRQTRTQAAPNVEPAGRIASRVQNRIQMRLHTRIDREYNPAVPAGTSFMVAEEQARKAGKPRR